MNNRKGFTLIELIATIVIISLILLVAMPSVTRVIFRNEKQQYNNYVSVVKTGASSYANKLKDDLGGSNNIGCVEVTLQELIKEEYVKAFNSKDVNCEGTIRLSNNRGKVDVATNITCNKKSGEQTFSKKEINTSESCVSYLKEDEDTLISKIDKNGFGSNGGTSVSQNITFVTGSNPNNYVWYSGKLWRIVSYTNDYIKLVSDDVITVLPRNVTSNVKYENSEVDNWLKTIFLPTLKDYNAFLTDTTFFVGPTSSLSSQGTSEQVTRKVGLLNSFEVNAMGSFFYNENFTYLLADYVDSTHVRVGFNNNVTSGDFNNNTYYAIRPAITMKPDNYILSGSGTYNSPYILSGNSTNVIEGTLLNSRYSGEYLYLGDDLYRIVSIDSVTKAIMVNNYSTSTFNLVNNFAFDKTNISNLLNVTYKLELGDDYKYIYTNAKWCNETIVTSKTFSNTCTSTVNVPIAIPRLGDIFTAGNENGSKNFWTINYNENNKMNAILGNTRQTTLTSVTMGVRPVVQLRDNTIIVSGDGTRNNPFKLSLN